ncbi:MAG: 30S ribosomal protein S27ae [Desulfurococcales archaeon]|nr:30S ribosomal protein S27ae [Desulfurococcales archaeon]
MGKKVKAYIRMVYEVDFNSWTIKLKNKKCPRCGSIMAHHMKPVERWHCGKCGYTEFVSQKKR